MKRRDVGILARERLIRRAGVDGRRTSGDGRQQWDGLAPGTYDVHADGGPRRGTAVGEVEVRAGAAARVTLRLPRE